MKYSDITRIDFGGGYETALAVTALEASGKAKEAVRKQRILLACVVAVAIAAAGWYAVQSRTPSEVIAPIDSAGGSEALSVRIESIPYWLQTDPRWAEETIGGSKERMAAAGCTVTCVAMALSTLGHQVTPLQLCQELKERDGFTDHGHLIWSTVKAVTQGKADVEFPALTHEAIDAALQEKRPVIAKIMLHGTMAHWVLIVGKSGREFIINDPLKAEGEPLRLSERSATILAVRVIRGK